MENKKVVCKYCKKSFTKDGDTVKVKNRYAHKECYEIHMKELQSLKELTDAINEVYVEWNREPNWALIANQIEKFVKEEGYTYEILKDRMEHHKQSPLFNLDKAYGVGFLRYEPFSNEIKTKDDVVIKLVKSMECEEEDV